jgi:hypothetical protein
VAVVVAALGWQAKEEEELVGGEVSLARQQMNNKQKQQV